MSVMSARRCNSTQCPRNTLPHLTTGQLGCFMSHFTIWHYMASQLKNFRVDLHRWFNWLTFLLLFHMSLFRCHFSSSFSWLTWAPPCELEERCLASTRATLSQGGRDMKCSQGREQHSCGSDFRGWFRSAPWSTKTRQTPSRKWKYSMWSANRF